MTVGIDARLMGPTNTRGIGRYIQELAAALLANPELELTLVVRSLESSPFQLHPRVTHVVADIPWYGWREQREMPKILNRLKVDVLHIPHWNAPFGLRRPFVMTVHDLILLHHPHSQKTSTRHPLIGWVKHHVFRYLLARNLKRASSILVPTEFVKQDILQRYRISESKITVTGEGIQVPPCEVTTPEIPPYLLYVGSAYPHKRLDLLLEAWKQLQKTQPTLELRLIGEVDTFMSKYQSMATSLERVHFLGRLPDEELFAQLRHATLFVFPSDDEGFGLPPLEALAMGCPVVSSNSSCLPEVLPSSGVILFQHGNGESLLRAIEHGLADQVRLRQEVAEVQTEIRTKHDWRGCAKRTRMVYNQSIRGA